MKIFGSRFVMAAGLAGVAGLMLNVNCGGGSSGGGTGGNGTGGTTTGTGGTHTGGTTGTGGSHTGGTTGTGGGAGASATGGTAGSSATGGTAGSSATGGAGGVKATGGAGGASATGGTAGGGAGTSGGAGNGGVGGAIVGTPLATFDPADGSADLDGFALNIYNNGAGSLDVATDAGAAATLTWTGGQGDPTPGALESMAPFHAYKEFIDVQKGFGTTALQNWTGKTKLHVRVKIASGLNPNPSFPTGVQPYLQSYNASTDGGAPGYNNCGKYNNAIAGNGWNDYIVDFSACPAPFDPSKIVDFGVLIQTGDGATGDAGQPASPTAAVIYFDSFSVE